MPLLVLLPFKMLQVAGVSVKAATFLALADSFLFINLAIFHTLASKVSTKVVYDIPTGKIKITNFSIFSPNGPEFEYSPEEL